MGVLRRLSGCRNRDETRWQPRRRLARKARIDCVHLLGVSQLHVDRERWCLLGPVRLGRLARLLRCLRLLLRCLLRRRLLLLGLQSACPRLRLRVFQLLPLQLRLRLLLRPLLLLLRLLLLLLVLDDLRLQLHVRRTGAVDFDASRTVL